MLGCAGHELAGSAGVQKFKSAELAAVLCMMGWA